MAVDGIIANGVTEILKKLISTVANEITLVWDFKDELKNLHTTLNMILAVMEDAEKKQVSDQVVRLWMEELKSIAYDADDILDEYSYEIIMSKHKKEDKSTILNKVRKVFSNSNPSFVCSWTLAHKIKEINEKFNKIAKRKNDLGLQIIDVGSSSSHVMMMNRETYSLVAADWKIVGRENDKSKIINTVLDKDSCLVFVIVGLGGMGKTTMAQLVYNDEVVHGHFQVKIWICVSDPFDVKKLFTNIVNSIGKAKKYDDSATMDDLAHGLQKALRGKKFLLVLDDVWNENPEDWYKFKTPFMVGAEGSKILITTRNMDVASIMIDKFLPYQLGILNNNDGWFLFKEIAFGSVAGAIESSKLVEIGKDMVKRCGGLPLALIFLGCLMRSKKKEEEWKKIRDTKIWHESYEGKNSKHRILPSLKLSYDYLPSHLRQCFSYCCIFPKDWEIQRETLIQLWMAEGFLIESPGENAMSIEEIGNEYFHNLLCNFFFQDVRRNENGDITTCKMHDLVHDLALSVVGKNECLVVENDHDIDCISETTFRLNLVNVNESMLPKVLEALKNAKNLRTAFVNYRWISFDIGKSFNKNKRLRVLDLSGSSNIQGSPSSSIGELKHLRYLHLPKDSITPKGITHLRFLQTLNKFTLGDNKKDAGIEELECLNLLTGDLIIDHLENLTSGTDAYRANLKEKKLRGLNLTWKMSYHYPAAITSNNHHNHHNNHHNNHHINHEVVLEGLRPHSNLRTLRIHGFEGAKLPRWIEDSSCLPNLEELTVVNGICIEQPFAGFGAFPSLRFLTLKRLLKLECIGNDFNYSAAGGSSSTTAATPTTIAFPPPSTTGATTCFPLLEKITISECPRLRTITPTTTIFPSLKVLELAYIDGRAVETLVTNHLNSLTSLTLSNITNLITLPHQGLMENNNTLLSLEIINCPRFKGFLLPNMVLKGGGGGGGGGQQQLQISRLQRIRRLTSLRSLKLYKCPALRFYPNIRRLSSLQNLEIQDCQESKYLQNELTCLSSCSLLEHLEYVKILKTTAITEEVVFEWRKSSSFKEEALMHGRHTLEMMSFKGRLIDIGMRCWWFPCSLLGLEGVSLWDECRCVWRMLLCLCLWLAAVLCIGAPLCCFS